MLQSSPEDLKRVTSEQNHCWHQAKVPELLAPPVERPLAHLLWQRLLNNEPARVRDRFIPSAWSWRIELFRHPEQTLPRQLLPGFAGLRGETPERHPAGPRNAPLGRLVGSNRCTGAL